MTSARRIFQVAALFLAALVTLPLALAQDLPSDVQQNLINQLNRTTQSNVPINPTQSLPSPLDQVRGLQRPYALGVLRRRPLPRSRLENDYSRRAGTALSQYGYDVFRSIIPSSGELQNGAVANNYRLSIGDELVITLQGQVSRSLRTRIDREGRLVIPELPPIPAAGRTFAAVRDDVEQAVAAHYLNTNAYVSVGSVRQIAVAVLGEAVAPGIYRMGGFATVLDALAEAGGIKKTGSLRRITLERNGHRSTIDLYAVMNAIGPEADLSLADGDRIVIPPVGPTVAVAGDVGRPGIFELLNGGAVAGARILALAGGALRPNGNRFIRLSLDRQGRNETSEALSAARLTLHPGDILLVQPRDKGFVGSVRLEGHVAVPGIRSLAAAPDVRRLLATTTFLDDPYLPFGVIATKDPRTQARRYFPVDLDAIVNGRQNRALKDGDTVIVLGVGDVNYINSADVQAILERRVPPLMREQIVTRNPRGNANAVAPAGALQGVPFYPPPEGRRFGQQALLPGAANQQQQMSQTLAGQQQGSQAVEQDLLPEYQETPNGTLDQSELYPGAPPTARATTRQVTAAELLAQRRAQICRGLQQLAAIVAASPPERFANAQFFPTPETPAAGQIENVFPCPPIFEKYPELLPLAVEHGAVIEGEVQVPGVYPVVSGASLASAVADAGGLTRDADLRDVEITHYDVNGAQGRATGVRQMVQLTPSDLAKVAVSPGDVVRFNPVVTDRDTGQVLLSGQFRRPGYYEIRRGERLSQLIARAGGLTDEAYPYGAVFTRQSVRQHERQDYARAASQLQSGLTSVLARGNVDQSQALVTATQQLVNELKSTPAVGRVVVEADPTVLEVKPQLDPIMEPGDTVFMPKRPFYVAVSGEVLNPTSLQFQPGASPADYIDEAGGFTQDAENDSTFVVLPNGEAEPVKVSFWDFTPVQVPPGSTIVVPKNLRPFDLATFLRDSTQIFSQLAISAASIAVIHSNSTQ